MMQSAGEPGLRPWHDLFMLCRRGSERVGVSDQGLPYIVADPRPRECTAESGQSDAVSTPVATDQASLA